MDTFVLHFSFHTQRAAAVQSVPVQCGKHASPFGKNLHSPACRNVYGAYCGGDNFEYRLPFYSKALEAVHTGFGFPRAADVLRRFAG